MQLICGFGHNGDIHAPPPIPQLLDDQHNSSSLHPLVSTTKIITTHPIHDLICHQHLPFPLIISAPPQPSPKIT